MLINRPFWQNLIEKAWEERTIIWLMGVRRVGKTSLCMSLPHVEYFDCERPSVRELFNDPEGFLAGKAGKRLILDEIHRLDNPSEILKLAADHYSTVKIIATGSSTLGASAKFKDTLTGRKREIWLTPLLLQELANFGSGNLQHRFLFGGLPSLFSSATVPEEDFKEWIDAYWAKDIQELFSVSKRYSFQKFTELLLAHSGGQFEASKFTAPCEISRETINNYLSILEETFVIHIIRPYSSHKPHEIVKAPKVYGFDTGLTCYAKGWGELRKEDMGLLWEQCVLNELHAYLQTHDIHYWRNKRGQEIDFVLQDKKNQKLTVIECKFSTLSSGKEMISAIGTNIEAFRQHYPQGENYVVASDVDHSFQRKYNDLLITFISPRELIDRVSR